MALTLGIETSFTSPLAGEVGGEAAGWGGRNWD